MPSRCGASSSCKGANSYPSPRLWEPGASWHLKRSLSAAERGTELNLSDDEVAFYDALETNDSAVKVLGDETLRMIARELVATVRANVTIDWTVRENVRAHLRVLVKRTLRKHGYPPDKQEKATQTVLEQAEVLSAAWAI
jgi:type I restriction enzyme, R subunit